MTVQTEVAEKIVSSLSASITPEEKIGLKRQYTDNPEAWYYYNKGRNFCDTRIQASYDSAEANYKKAIELDTSIMRWLIPVLAELYLFNQKGLTQKEALPIARNFANKALALDSTLAQASHALALLNRVLIMTGKRPSRCLKKPSGWILNMFMPIFFMVTCLFLPVKIKKAQLSSIKLHGTLNPCPPK